MTYNLYKWGRFEAELITYEEFKQFKLSKNFLLNENLNEINSLVQELKKLKQEYEELNKKKSEIVNELETFKDSFSELKKEVEQYKKEIQEQNNSLMQEQKNLNEQLVKNLNSEYLKRLDKQIKPEDIDVREIINEFYNRANRTLTSDEADELILDIGENIPKLNLPQKIKFKILQARDKLNSSNKEKDEYNLFVKDVLREVIDAINSGADLNNITFSSGKKSKQRQTSEGDLF